MAEYHVQKKTEDQKSVSNKSNNRTVQAKQNGVAGIIQMAKTNPNMLTTNDVIVLQKTIGNQAVCQLFSSSDTQQNEIVKKKEETSISSAPIQMMTYNRLSGCFGFLKRYNQQEKDLNKLEKKINQMIKELRVLVRDNDLFTGQLDQIKSYQDNISDRPYQMDEYEQAQHDLYVAKWRVNELTQRFQEHIYNNSEAAFRESNEGGGISGAKLNQMNNLQAIHSNIIDFVHRNNLDLFIPGANDMGEELVAQAREDWNLLRNETGKIKTKEGTSEQTKKELRAMNARLMTGGRGRNLLHQVLHPDEADVDKRDINIEETFAINDPVQRRQLRLEKRALELKLARLEEIYTPLADREYDDIPQEIREEIEQINEYEIRPRLYVINESLGEPGTADTNTKTLSILKGFQDGAQLNEDSSGRHIAAPAFIAYGHELIHILHGQKNTKEIQPYSEESMEKWSNAEEFNTIHGRGGELLTENTLRAEHQLPTRQWHTGKSREELGIF